MKTFRLFVAFALTCFALSPAVHAVVPALDGGYPGGNTAEGQSALFSLTTGGYNTAVGFSSLRSDTIGSYNTAIGAGALLANTGVSGGGGGGDQNTAVGAGALLSNTIGLNNTATGSFALLINTTGGGNTAIGAGALLSNTTGPGNTANGSEALFNNTSGTANTAVGVQALYNNIDGSRNIALGYNAGFNVHQSTSDVICIGSPGLNRSNSCYIGQIFGEPSDGGIAVIINSDGKLGTPTSSRRFKKAIQPIGKASEAILALKPVTFHYKNDTTATPQFGLIAEEVAAVNPDLVVRDKEGKPFSVRYDQVNAMLLNEFLKEHKAFVEEHRTVEELKKEVAALTAGLQKVSAQLELNKPAPQTVLNRQ